MQFYRQKKHVDVIEIQSTVPAWHMRAMAGIKLQKENNERYVSLNHNGEEITLPPTTLEVLEDKIDSYSAVSPQNDEIAFLVVNQILGTFADSGALSPYHYRLVMHYWRDKTRDPTPLVISYEYQAS
ncbi:hypothetical protein DES39_2034 [Orbus hercynius]|uniref:Uncharacterized protein n=1 Tax=Orbus hercynius TaxID=593135 RepID=A0A495RBG2_9GAMM|nr:hypothetical protein DES39_2034 [Orbus hercynius]